jgi:hypothetical protein
MREMILRRKLIDISLNDNYRTGKLASVIDPVQEEELLE